MITRMSQSPIFRSTFRPDIEGLRGIAVLLVVAFHCGIPGFSGGFIGVDVFFVLSGYLITGLLVNEMEKTSTLNLIQFYARRVRRLLPASALMLLCTLLVGAIIMAPHELNFAARAARASTLYLSNVFFAMNAADYFAPDVKSNPMLHTWSLSVEEQFYLFWPLLIMLSMRLWRSRKALFLVLSVLTFISLALAIRFTAKGGTFAFYELPARAWEFGIGGLAVLLPREVKLSHHYRSALGWSGLLAIVGAGHFILGNTNFPGWIALIPALGTSMVLIAGTQQSSAGVDAALAAAPLQKLGTLSYSWYLWHWPFLVFAAALFPNISIAGKAVAALISLAIAALMHEIVENPIRFHPVLMKRPAFSLGLAGMATVCSLSAASLSMRFAARLTNTSQMKTLETAIDDIAIMPRQQCVSLGDSAEMKTCVFGNTSSETNVVLFGDSHAIQWFNPLVQIVKHHGWKLTTIVKSGCMAVDIRSPGSDAFAKNCSDWRAESIQKIIALHPSFVVIGNATNYFGHQSEYLRENNISTNDWRLGTRKTLEALTAAGLRVGVIRDNPAFIEDIPTCLARSVRHAWYPSRGCEMNKSASLNPAIFEAEKAGALGLPNVHFIDLTDSLCGRDVCPTVQGQVVMYRDNNHLTGSFASTLEPTLAADLLPMIHTRR